MLHEFRSRSLEVLTSTAQTPWNCAAGAINERSGFSTKSTAAVSWKVKVKQVLRDRLLLPDIQDAKSTTHHRKGWCRVTRGHGTSSPSPKRFEA